ncbi:MAG TPA: hypothetical protein VGR57_05945 [Ktedonobacterales bacterium]|nr:hypothetical protein [Ktedonobacterales bacterium]
MFGIRRRKTSPAATKGHPIVEHPAEFVRHQARTHGITQGHKTLLASTLASPPPLANQLPTQTPKRKLSAMVAGSPTPAGTSPARDEASVAPVATPEAVAGDAPWDSSSRA